MDKRLRELLAEQQHNIWASWMVWLFTTGKKDECGNYIIPWSLVERWERQMATNYFNLPKSEKDSDREVADKIIKLIVDYEDGKS